MLDLVGIAEKVKALGDVYNPRCLMPTPLTSLRSLRKAWGILQDGAKKMRISEACAPLWAWLRVGFLTDYVVNLDH